MEDILESLKDENRRLSRKAELDWLTGLYNRMTVEEKVNRRLEVNGTGVLFVLDVDDFKSINDRYGHIAGDQVLQGIACILKKMVFRNDIVGRVGGDEFVIFMSVNPNPDFISERCRQIKQQFLDLPRSLFTVSKLSMTVCGSSYQRGDTYQCMFDRADQCLLKEKSIRRRGPSGRGVRQESIGKIRSLEVDMEQVSRELSESNPHAGAFCQDYDSFVSIYRFVERRLQRVQSSVYSLLFTLSDSCGNFPDLPERTVLMEKLYDVIRRSLRAGDVFTRYSSCQYLTLISDATDEQTDAIAHRIRDAFMGCPALSCQYELLYKRYPLKPASLSTDDDEAGPTMRV